MRLAFTIILNGEQHLLHNGYAEYLLENCLDFWSITEGACHSTGSTTWCKGDNSKYHENGHSIDDTRKILEDLKKKYPDKLNIKYNVDNFLWDNKDRMVNAAIDGLKNNGYKKGFLWQIDIDEQWTVEDMEYCEAQLGETYKMGQIKFNQYVGKDIVAKGPNWGDNWQNRLWNWNGETFDRHEPPVLNGGNGKTIQINKACEHYSYYFEDDVRFKADWYGYGDLFFQKWKKLQSETEFPQPLSRLFSGYESENGKIIKR